MSQTDRQTDDIIMPTADQYCMHHAVRSAKTTGESTYC